MKDSNKKIYELKFIDNSSNFENQQYPINYDWSLDQCSISYEERIAACIQGEEDRKRMEHEEDMLELMLHWTDLIPREWEDYLDQNRIEVDFEEEYKMHLENEESIKREIEEERRHREESSEIFLYQSNHDNPSDHIKIEANNEDEVNGDNEIHEEKVSGYDFSELRKLYTPSYVRDTAYFLEDHPPLNYIVDGLILENSLNIWFGKAGIGKTWTIIDLAVCLASGKDWCGRKTNPSSVLIVDEESGVRPLSSRIKKSILTHFPNEGTDEIKRKVRIQSMSYQSVNFSQDREKWILEIGKIAFANQHKLIIIDSFIGILSGCDENSSNDIQIVCASLRRIIKGSGASILVLHHANKSDELRGSTAINAAVDSVVHIKRSKNDTFSFESTKNRYGEKIDFTAKASWTNDGSFSLKYTDNSNHSNSKQGKDTENDLLVEEKILELYKKYGTISNTDLIAKADFPVHSGTLSNVQSKLVEKKLIERVSGGGRGKPTAFKYIG